MSLKGMTNQELESKVNELKKGGLAERLASKRLQEELNKRKLEEFFK